MNSGLIKLQEFRNEAGRRLYQMGNVHQFNENIFHVESENSENVYVINNNTCSCPDYEKRSKILVCKHLMATKIYLEAKEMLILGN